MADNISGNRGHNRCAVKPSRPLHIGQIVRRDLVSRGRNYLDRVATKAHRQ